MPTAVVTGANSGIGHEFAKVLIDAVSPSAMALLTQPSLPTSRHETKVDAKSARN